MNLAYHIGSTYQILSVVNLVHSAFTYCSPKCISAEPIRYAKFTRPSKFSNFCEGLETLIIVTAKLRVGLRKVVSVIKVVSQ